MNKVILSGVIIAIGVIVIALAAILGWVVVPDIIDKKIEEVRLQTAQKIERCSVLRLHLIYLLFFRKPN